MERSDSLTRQDAFPHPPHPPHPPYANCTEMFATDMSSIEGVAITEVKSLSVDGRWVAYEGKPAHTSAILTHPASQAACCNMHEHY